MIDLVAKVPCSCEDHCDPVVIGGGDNLSVAHGSPRLDHCGGAGVDRLQEPVRKREEGVGSDCRAVNVESSVLCLLRRNPCGFHA